MFEKIERIVVPLMDLVFGDKSFGGYILENIKSGHYYIEVEQKHPYNVLLDRVPRQYIENKFYNITCSDVDFIKKLDLNKNMFLSPAPKSGYDISMTQTERNFLFNFVKKTAPKNVMEFSPFHGFSTLTISNALREVGIVPDFFETHELEKENIKLTEFLLYENDINFVTVKEGDVFDTVDREKLKDVDFLMIDSDHSGGFAQKYLKEFFPLLKNECWVVIHDISCDEYFASDERIEVVNYLKQNNIKTYFHIGDLMKIYQIVDDDFVWSNSRNTLLFYQVKK